MQCEIPSNCLLGTPTGGLRFPSLLLAVCIMNQVVLTPLLHPGHAVRFSGFAKCGDISCASGGFFFSHLCTMLNGFWAGSDPRAKSICCGRLKECIGVSRGTSTDH